jgi:hypothetical protein
MKDGLIEWQPIEILLVGRAGAGEIDGGEKKVAIHQGHP